LCFCFLMISNIKFESFKKSTERRSKKTFYLILTFLLTISLVSIIFNSISLLNMVSVTILTYILSSILFTIYRSI
jgi:phosphatidylserine synthase